MFKDTVGYGARYRVHHVQAKTVQYGPKIFCKEVKNLGTVSSLLRLLLSFLQHFSYPGLPLQRYLRNESSATQQPFSFRGTQKKCKTNEKQKRKTGNRKKSLLFKNKLLFCWLLS